MCVPVWASDLLKWELQEIVSSLTAGNWTLVYFNSSQEFSTTGPLSSPLHFMFWGRLSHWNLSSPFRLDWPASELQGSTCFCPPLPPTPFSTRIIGICCHTIFKWVLSIKFRSSLYPLSHLQTLPFSSLRKSSHVLRPASYPKKVGIHFHDGSFPVLWGPNFGSFVQYNTL